MSEDHTVTLTPSDVLGMVQRALTDMHGYLGQHPMQVDVNQCFAHMDAMKQRLATLQAMQQTIMQAQQAQEGAAKGKGH